MLEVLQQLILNGLQMAVQLPLPSKVTPKAAAGLLMFKVTDGLIRVFIVHPGGPAWKNKDIGSWSIPKGEVNAGEDLFATAKREFTEETGFPVNDPLYPIGQITQKSGKVVTAWAFEGDVDSRMMKCNEIVIDFPRGSGKMITIPEVDRGEYFSIEDAKDKLNPAQIPFLERLKETIPLC